MRSGSMEACTCQDPTELWAHPYGSLRTLRSTGTTNTGIAGTSACSSKQGPPEPHDAIQLYLVLEAFAKHAQLPRYYKGKYSRSHITEFGTLNPGPQSCRNPASYGSMQA